MCFTTGSTLIISFLGSILALKSEPICVVDVSFISFLNIWDVFFKVVTRFTLDLVLYLCVPFLALMMTLFHCFFPLWSHGAVVLVYPLLFFQISFLVLFHFYQLNAGFWLAEKKIGVFDWSTGWSSSGYAPIKGVLRGSALLNILDCGVLFIWVPSWLISWSFLWLTFLTGTLWGISGGVYFSEYIG